MTVRYENALPTGYRLDGTQQGQYEILSILGAGGFGITYKARDHLLQSDVAIKEYLPMDLALRQADGVTIVPRATSQDEDYQWGLEQFMDEARTLSRFKTEPNIVRVESFIQANNTAYMVMQYEDGESLEMYLERQGILNEEQVKAVIMPILLGLRALHAEHFLHRDIKPGNIYLRKNGTPILLDFGAARQALSDHSRSVTGILTAGYAPFEQYSTRAKLLPATDLYAFGATLYKCITGVTPVEATERLDAMHNGVADPLPPAESITKGSYSRVLFDALHWLMQPLSKDRPQSVDEVINFLNAPPAQPQSNQTVFVDAGATRPAPAQTPPPNYTSPAGQAPQPNYSTPPAYSGTPTSYGAQSNPSSFNFEKQPKSWLNKIIVPTLAAIIVASVAVVITLTLQDGGQTTTKEKSAEAPTEKPTKVAEANKKTAPKKAGKSGVIDKGGDKADPTPKKTIITGKGKSDAEKADIEKRYRLGVNYFNGTEGYPQAYDKAFENFDYAANKGHADAQGYLGLMYLGGVHVAKDLDKGYQWTKKAAEAGVVRAMNNLGSCYSNGYGTAKNDVSAFNWYRKAAENGSPLGQYNLARQYHNGKGTAKNPQEAMRWYRKAADTGLPRAMAAVGELHYYGVGVPKNHNIAFTWYLKAAKRNYRSAQYNIALMYANGRGTPKNIREALRWYEVAAKRNHPGAQYNLGLYYLYGEGVKKDYTRAFNLFKASAKQGEVLAFNKLGDMFWFGLGRTKNYKTALKFFEFSAEKNNSYAQMRIGTAYQNGYGYSKNYTKARTYYLKSANQGHASGQFYMAVIYDFGLGVPKNYKQAAYWYTKAAAQGHNSSLNNLGSLYRYAQGVPRDYRKAMQLYLASAKKKNPTAMRNIGNMYELGHGVPKNLRRARKWYQLALKYGNKNAQKDLARLQRQEFFND